MRELDFQHVPAIARRIALDELTTRLSALEVDLAEERTKSADLVKQLALAREEMSSLKREQAARIAERLDEEIATCRGIAEKCVFVVGFCRSYTTISLGILNCAPRALLLGEANFFLRGHGHRFTDWYNDQHLDFGNQITKSSYAPDFLPGRPHTWWEWLEGAAHFYDCIGEKVALSDYHLAEVPPEVFRTFYEARFLAARYIFMLRNPVDVLLSSAKMLNIADDFGMAKLCAGWLDFMQLWADLGRVFPHTMTVICERFGESTVREFEAFTGLELGDAQLLISSAKKRKAALTEKFPTLVRLKPDLEQLYADAVAAVDENRVLWQAEQKRDANVNKFNDAISGSGTGIAHPLGEMWLRAKELRANVREVLEEGVREP